MLVIGPSWGFIEDVFAGILCLSSAGYRGLQWCSLLAGSRSRRYPESNHVALTGKFITYCLFLGHFYVLPLLPRIINLFVQITPGGMPRGHEIVIILPFGYIWRMTDFPTKFSMHIHN